MAYMPVVSLGIYVFSEQVELMQNGKKQDFLHMKSNFINFIKHVIYIRLDLP